MALELGIPQIIGKKVGEKLLAKQDILSFTSASLRMVNSPGPPIGKYNHGDFFLNGADRKLYFQVNHKLAHMPTLAWYKCNSVTDDELIDNVLAKTGTISGPTLGTGKYGRCLSFDGVNDKVTLPDDLHVDENSTWNFSCWVYFPNWDIDDRIYLFERYVDFNHFFKLYIREENLRKAYLYFQYRDGTHSEDNYMQAGWMEPGNWYHISISYSGSVFRATVNGGSQRNLTLAVEPMGFTTEEYNLGYSTLNTSYGTTDFLMDGIKVWNEDRHTDANYPKIDLLNIDENQWVSYTPDGVT